MLPVLCVDHTVHSPRPAGRHAAHPLLGGLPVGAATDRYLMHCLHAFHLVLHFAHAPQVATLLIPFCVILAWMMGQPLSMDFNTFEAASYSVVILLAIICIIDGSSNWLKARCLYALVVNLSAIIDGSSNWLKARAARTAPCSALCCMVDIGALPALDANLSASTSNIPVGLRRAARPSHRTKPC